MTSDNLRGLERYGYTGLAAVVFCLCGFLAISNWQSETEIAAHPGASSVQFYISCAAVLLSGGLLFKSIRIRSETDMLRAQQLDAQNKVREMFETCPMGVSIFTRGDRERLFANSRLIEMAGLEVVDGAVKTPVVSTFADGVIPKDLSDAVAAGATVTGYEVERVRPDGSRWWGQIGASRTEFEQHSAVIVWQLDITERKRAEEQLREGERTLRALLDLSPVGITIIVPDASERLYANDAMARMLGFEAEMPLSDWGVEDTFCDPADLDRLLGTAAAEKGLMNVEALRRRADGSCWWCLHNARPIVFGGREALIVWHIDITSRKDIEVELSRKEQQLRSTLDNAPAGILLTDSEKKIMVANTEIREILNVPPEMVAPGKSYADVLRLLVERGDYGAVDKEQVLEKILDTLENPSSGAYEYTPPSGRVFSVRRHSVGDGSVVTISVDVTELKRIEERLRKALWDLELAQEELVQSEKMASLGGLVAGVAHEINTPIGSAVTAASHVREETRKLKQAFESNIVKRSQFTTYMNIADEGTRIIESNLGRAAQLISSFKQVAVDQSSEERRSFNLDAYLSETMQSLQPQLKPYPRVALEVELDADVVVDSYPGVFAQIISNLLVNALIHAFGEEGEGRILIRTVALGNQVRITFDDNGSGMSAETREHIFEPFFTTRRGAGGSGLGMHIVYNLVTTKLSGTIRCFSNPGEGTRFDVTIPINPEPDQPGDSP